MINELPKDWKWVKLGEVCGIVYGKGLLTKNLKVDGFPVFGANGVIGFNDKYLYEEPMVLISCRGAYSGKINFSPPKSYITNNSLVLDVKSKKELDKNYLFYSLIAAKKTKLITGTAQPQVTINNAVELDIPLPPLTTQQAIVTKIEELFSELDKGIENMRTAQQQLKTYRQSVLKWAFEGKLTNEKVKERVLPKGWKRVELGEVCSNVEYGSGAKSKEHGKIPVLRMGNIQNGRFDWGDLVYTDDDDEIKKYLLKKDDVLFNRTNSAELVGKTAIYKGERPAIFAGYLIRINFKKELLEPNYLNYYLNSLEAKKYGNSVRSFGVNQSNINGTKLKTYPINLPPLEEQLQIVQAIESRLSVADKMEESITQSLQ
jgi:type I restriction enzyme S subunit